MLFQESRLTSEDEPRERQNDDVGRHVQGGVYIVELGLIEAGALNRLVPVKVDGSALQEEADGEGAFGSNDPCGDTVERLPPYVVRRQDSEEKQDDGQLDHTQRRGVQDLRREATL